MSIPVSNTSPLIAFSRIDRLDLLKCVVPRILIPAAVFHELHDGARTGEPIIEALRAGGEWIEVRSVAESPLLASLKTNLGAGEAEAVALAMELGTTVIVEDKGGRAAAERLGLNYVGNLWVIREAKRLGAIRAFMPAALALRAVGIYYKDALLDQIAREEGEA